MEYVGVGTWNSVNNFVCFGTNTTPCPTDNLYRIIGVFGDKVKLIKSDYATTALLGADGDYSKMYTANNWDNSAYKGNNLANVAAYNWNKTGQNTWSLSNLNKTNLNQNFITNIGADWAAKIDDTTWKVGGNTYDKIRDAVPSVAYQNEIVSPVTTNSQDNATELKAKIGLMYASDYGFAAAPSAWTANLNTYHGEAIKNVNWMHEDRHGPPHKASLPSFADIGDRMHNPTDLSQHTLIILLQSSLKSAARCRDDPVRHKARKYDSPYQIRSRNHKSPHSLSEVLLPPEV